MLVQNKTPEIAVSEQIVRVTWHLSSLRAANCLRSRAKVITVQKDGSYTAGGISSIVSLGPGILCGARRPLKGPGYGCGSSGHGMQRPAVLIRCYMLGRPLRSTDTLMLQKKASTKMIGHLLMLHTHGR